MDAKHTMETGNRVRDISYKLLVTVISSLRRIPMSVEPPVRAVDSPVLSNFVQCPISRIAET